MKYDFTGLPEPNRYSIKKQRYYDLPVGFDIETTNLKSSRHAYMYVWQCAVYDRVFFGRTWADFKDFLDELREYYKTDMITILVHNLAFEMSFLLPQIWQWGYLDKIFAKEAHKPLSVRLKNRIEFRDTLALENCSLKSLAQRYCKTQKLSGDDYNYSILRSPADELSELELAYCRNDVLILSEYAEYLHKEYTRKYKKIPLTSTGIVRTYIKSMIARDYGRISTAHLYPDSAKEYQIYMRWLFRGGYTHANSLYIGQKLTTGSEIYGKKIDGVRSMDLTSAYPSVMLQCKYPITPFIRHDIKNIERFIEQNEDRCFIALVEFTNIYATTAHTVESYHKAIQLQGEVVENGRIYRADKLTVLITDVDYRIYKMFYKWESMRVILFKSSRLGELPPYLTDAIKEFYGNKKRLKAIKNRTEEEDRLYMRSKAMLNSVYGMTVSRMYTKEIYYDGQYQEKEGESYEKQINKSFLSPFWGIWVTAYVRERILSAIYQMSSSDHIGDDAIYSDTDSIKYLGDYTKLFDTINKEILEQNKTLKDPELLDIGLFDDETPEPYESFLTYGAKRYMYKHKGEIHSVIAGLPRRTITDYVKKYGEEKLWDIYKPYMTFETSGKLTHIYQEPCTDIINGYKCEELGGCYLEDAPFTMSVDREFMRMAMIRQKEF